jgi:general secretion pathway protein I
LSKNRADRPGVRRDSGFTLIEVVVALAIAALGLGVLMAAVSQGTGNVTAANLYIEATRRAQTHLDSVGLTAPLRSGEETGDDGGGFTWRVKIVQSGTRAPPQGGNQPAVGLFDLTVTISWRTGLGAKSLSLQSERLARVVKL